MNENTLQKLTIIITLAYEMLFEITSSYSFSLLFSNSESEQYFVKTEK